jgi:hypothetical protein
MKEALFSALFVINDKVQGDLGVLGPHWIGRRPAISLQITTPIAGFSIVLVRLHFSRQHLLVQATRNVKKAAIIQATQRTWIPYPCQRKNESNGTYPQDFLLAHPL